MAIKASCRVCEWEVVLFAPFLSATELTTLYEHACGCGDLPEDPRGAGAVLDRFEIVSHPAR